MLQSCTQAYLLKASNEVVAGGHLLALLGVFQKLISSKVRVSLCVSIAECGAGSGVAAACVLAV